MTFYSISKKSEDTKAFNWKIFFQQVLSLCVTFQVNHIGLQQWWSRVCKIKDSDFTVPRCTSHCFAFPKHASGHQRNKTSQFCEYTTSTQLRTSYKNRNQLDWFRGSDEEETVKKILLTDVAEQIKPVYKTNCSRKKNFDRRTPTSVPKRVFCKQGKVFSRKRQGQADLGQNKLKRYTGEYLPI